MTFEEILVRDGMLVYKTRGTSMLPMLHEDRDLVTIRVPGGRLRRYDVALYRRGKDCVLHRVIAVHEKDYLIRGDNTCRTEIVPSGDVIGVLTEFRRNGKQHGVEERGYRAYARLWCAIYPVRAAGVICLGKAKAVIKKLVRQKGADTA